MTGAEWAAWVSAAAAVIQAFAAGAAIFYSGKLARESAEREIAAERNAEQRIAKAAEEAERQRLFDREAEVNRRKEQEREAYNEPIEAAIKMAVAVREELQQESDRCEERDKRGGTGAYSRGALEKQKAALERLSVLEAKAIDVDVALWLRRLRNAIKPAPESQSYYDDIWIAHYAMQVQSVDQALDGLRKLVRGIPNLPAS